MKEPIVFTKKKEAQKVMRDAFKLAKMGFERESYEFAKISANSAIFATFGDWKEWQITECEVKETAYIANYGQDVFQLFDDGRVHWIYYNPDGNEEKGQYVENYFDVETIKSVASKTMTADEFFDLVGSEAKQYIIDNDGGEKFESLRKSVTNDDFDIVGCDEAAWQALPVLLVWSINAKFDYA